MPLSADTRSQAPGRHHTSPFRALRGSLQASIPGEQHKSSLRSVPGRNRSLKFVAKCAPSIYSRLLLIFAHELYHLLPYPTNGYWEGELLLFISNISLCVSLSPWKVWIQGQGRSLARLPDASLLPGTCVLVAILGKLKTSISKPGAPQFPVSCGPCTCFMLPEQLEIGSYHQIVTFWPVAQGIGMNPKSRSTEDFGGYNSLSDMQY